MSFIEFIGFIISISAMVFLFGRQTWENYRRRNYPEEYAKEVQKKDDALKELLKSMNIEVEEEFPEDEDEEEEEEKLPPRRPPPFRPQPVQQSVAAAIAQGKRETEARFSEYSSEKMSPIMPASEKDAYALGITAKPPRGKVLLMGLRSPQDLFVIKEIIGPPRCDREWT